MLLKLYTYTISIQDKVFKFYDNIDKKYYNYTRIFDVAAIKPTTENVSILFNNFHY